MEEKVLGLKNEILITINMKDTEAAKIIGIDKQMINRYRETLINHLKEL